MLFYISVLKFFSLLFFFSFFVNMTVLLTTGLFHWTRMGWTLSETPGIVLSARVLTLPRRIPVLSSGFTKRSQSRRDLNLTCIRPTDPITIKNTIRLWYRSKCSGSIPWEKNIGIPLLKYESGSEKNHALIWHLTKLYILGYIYELLTFLTKLW